MLQNEKLITNVLSVLGVILILDTLFVFFNNKTWPIIEMGDIGIYGLPYYFFVWFSCSKLPNLRNSKRVMIPIYLIIALNVCGLAYRLWVG